MEKLKFNRNEISPCFASRNQKRFIHKFSKNVVPTTDDLFLNLFEHFFFNINQIKIFMAMLMVLDHLHYLGPIFPEQLAMVFHVLTRIVGVWFAYSAVEGFMYTSNVKKYMGRLFSAALIMLVGNTIINFMLQSKNIRISNNIFLTLARGVLILYCIKNISNKILKYLVVVIIFLFGVLFSEGGLILLPFMLITYLTYGKNVYRNIAYLVLSIALFFMSYVDYGNITTTLNMLAYNSDFLFVFIIPILYMYNGERGSNSSFAKYFFYVFYPLHIWIIAIIGYFIS